MKTLIALQDRFFMDELHAFLRQQSWDAGSELNILHVVDSPQIGYYADLDLHRRLHAKANEMMSSIVNDIAKGFPKIAVKGLVTEGDPKEEIIQQAQSLNTELIVMGTHGRSMLGRVFLGSVSLAVVASAPCSVLILRPLQREKCSKPALIKAESMPAQ